MNAELQREAQRPFARMFEGLDFLEVVSADLKRSTLTLRMGHDMPVPRGKHCLVSESAALAMLAEEEHGVRLQPPRGDVFVCWDICDDLGFKVEATGFIARIYYRRVPGKYPSQMSGRYWGSQYLMDQWGREWEMSLPEMVTDDFGSLVPVDGGVL